MAKNRRLSILNQLMIKERFDQKLLDLRENLTSFKRKLLYLIFINLSWTTKVDLKCPNYNGNI